MCDKHAVPLCPFVRHHILVKARRICLHRPSASAATSASASADEGDTETDDKYDADVRVAVALVRGGSWALDAGYAGCRGGVGRRAVASACGLDDALLLVHMALGDTRYHGATSCRYG